MKSRTEISEMSFKVLSPFRLCRYLQRPTGVEVAHRQIDAIGFQLFQEIRPSAGSAEAAVNVACVIGMFLGEAIDILRLDLFALHANDFTDAYELALSVRQALQLHDDRYRGCDLAADAADGRRHSGHGDHLFKPLQRIAWRIRVDRRHRAFVARIHGLQHVEGFLAATFADDDAVRPHAQRVLHQLALADFSSALGVGRTRLEAPN